MKKLEYNEKTWNVIVAHAGKVPLILYQNLLETHSALHARATTEEYPTHAKSFKVYKIICDALAADYEEMGDYFTAMRYRLRLVRAARHLKQKGDK